jgi:hypothetical protein
MGKFAVAHIAKGSKQSGQLGQHIDRNHEVPNADPERSKENRFAVRKGDQIRLVDQAEFRKLRDSGQVPGMSKAVQQRIDEGHNGQRAIRKDAVTQLNVMLSGSHDQMKEIERKGQLGKWMQENYKFLSKEFGGKNVVRFAVHMDERTPHIHATVVPLTKDGRLSAKEVVGDKAQLKSFQDRYAGQMAQFGLERGLEGRKTPHKTTAEYYRELNNAGKLQFPEGTLKERAHGPIWKRTKEQYLEVPKKATDAFVMASNGKVRELEKSNQEKGYKIIGQNTRLQQQEKQVERLEEHNRRLNGLVKNIREGKVTPEQLQLAHHRREQEKQQSRSGRDRGRGM